MSEKKVFRREIDFGGRKLVLESGRLAPQANGAVLARYGDTTVLATAVADEPREELDYFPLTVDYIERLYAGGKIKTSRFIKREGKPSDEAVLADRLIDRVIRPLFPKDYLSEVQVVIIVLSVDQDNDPDLLSLIAASAALHISDIPWRGPVGAVRIGHKDGSFILNPTKAEKEFSDLELVVGASSGKVVMLEAGADQVEESVLLGAIEFATKNLSPALALVEKMRLEVGIKKVEYEALKIEVKLKREIEKFIEEEFLSKFEDPRRLTENDWIEDAKEVLYSTFGGRLQKSEMAKILEEHIKTFVRRKVLKEGVRCDGRRPDEVRPIGGEVGLLPRTHGSALFQRGQTQVLTSATLGSTSLEQLIEGMTGEETKRYIHHYFFPPFSAGEAGRIGAPKRREIGHGALAERALLPVVPAEEKFPYAIRLVSEVLSSAGSTSMASACGSTLALMDAGVPIAAPVAGLSIGLVSDRRSRVVLSDIGPFEDAGGDMDFKIAGTEKGITAVQMDTKLDGLSPEIIKEAVERGREGRLLILKEMLKIIGAPREGVSAYAPKITRLQIDPAKIGLVIGGGGRTIKGIIEATGVAIDVEDDGSVLISSTNEEQAQKAKEWIEGLVHQVEAGDIIEGKATRVTDFGVFVEVKPGKEGLIHVSELSHRFVKSPAAVIKVGEMVKAKVVKVDERGRINLSKKALESPPAGQSDRPEEFRRRTPAYRAPYYKRGYRPPYRR